MHYHLYVQYLAAFTRLVARRYIENNIVPNLFCTKNLLSITLNIDNNINIPPI
jgi:hypothetical protein